MGERLFDDGTTSSAVISDDGRYRYRLGRTWHDDLPYVVWIMLNPSTADADTDDATIRRCTGFARQWQAGGIVVVNLFAYRTAYPTELKAAADEGIDIVGELNDEHIADAVFDPMTSLVVCAWGAGPGARRRAAAVHALVVEAMREPMCLGITKKGDPTHPLYVANDRELVEWTLPS